MYVDPQHYADALANAKSCYDWLPERIEPCAYETAYYMTYGELPENHSVIEYVIAEEGADLVFVHYGTGDDA
jgi:hypothetical protein